MTMLRQPRPPLFHALAYAAVNAGCWIWFFLNPVFLLDKTPEQRMYGMAVLTIVLGPGGFIYYPLIMLGIGPLPDKAVYAIAILCGITGWGGLGYFNGRIRRSASNDKNTAGQQTHG